jgi:hypothetical protein
MCRERETGSIMAMKVVKKKVIATKDEVYHVLSKNTLLPSLNNPFIVVSMVTSM